MALAGGRVVEVEEVLDRVAPSSLCCTVVVGAAD